jgi:formamidopyrimidine-DNA glycosylase
VPELPDLEYVVARLRETAVGRRVTAARVTEPIVLRVTIPGDFVELVTDRTLETVERRGHFLLFSLGELDLVVNPMLAGRFRFAEAAAKKEASMCFALAFEQLELRYLDDKKMGKAYLVKHGDHRQIPALRELGADILSDTFTLDAFKKLAKKRRDQVRAFLMDKRALAAIGNAYADEILFASRIHPKTWVRQLSDDELKTLHKQIGVVMRAAIKEVARRGAPIDEKVRDFLAVRGRKGEPCKNCGTTLRAVRVLDHDSVFCPQCQPAKRSQFIDWSKLPEKKK